VVECDAGQRPQQDDEHGQHREGPAIGAVLARGRDEEQGEDPAPSRCLRTGPAPCPWPEGRRRAQREQDGEQDQEDRQKPEGGEFRREGAPSRPRRRAGRPDRTGASSRRTYSSGSPLASVMSLPRLPSGCGAP
jgi:hypothetical protein